MKAFLQMLLLGLVLALGPMAGSQAADKPAAVLFHADWCLNCKLMKPRLATLQQQYGDRIEFIRVDYTTDAGRAEGKALAKGLGGFAQAGWDGGRCPARDDGRCRDAARAGGFTGGQRVILTRSGPVLTGRPAPHPAAFPRP